jgi:hypothetical protein
MIFIRLALNQNYQFTKYNWDMNSYESKLELNKIRKELRN